MQCDSLTGKNNGGKIVVIVYVRDAHLWWCSCCVLRTVAVGSLAISFHPSFVVCVLYIVIYSNNLSNTINASVLAAIIKL